MSDKPNHPMYMLTLAFIFGGIGDLILRTPSHGLNYTLWFMGLVALVYWKIRDTHIRLPLTAQLFLWMAIVLACIPTLSDSKVLKTLSLIASFLALFLSSMSYRKPTHLTQSYFVPFIARLLERTFYSLLVFFITIPDIQEYRENRPKTTPKIFPAIIRGILISVPLLYIFIRLFMSADKNYESMIHKLWGFDVLTILENIFFIALYAWVALTISSPFLHANKMTSMQIEHTKKDTAKWSMETIVVLACMNIVFISYVYFQLGYLFGGIEHILNTENLTIAEYARRGFFESLLAAILVLIILLTFDEFLKDLSSTLRKCFLSLSFIQVALVSVVILSALQRMNIYKSTFGLTEDRFYVYAILLWMLGTFAWFMVCLIKHKNHQRHFILGTLIWGYGCLFTAIAINPHAHIATVNIAHIQAGGAVESRTGIGRNSHAYTLDSQYLMSLSEDATPILLANLDMFSPEDQQELMGTSKTKYPKSTHTWKNWCWSRSRAHAVRQQVYNNHQNTTSQ